MIRIINKISKWFERNKLNILTGVITFPTLVSVLGILTQGFAFALLGEWLIPSQQLAIGLITSLAYTIGGYKLWVYLKLIRDVR